MLRWILVGKWGEVNLQGWPERRWTVWVWPMAQGTNWLRLKIKTFNPVQLSLQSSSTKLATKRLQRFYQSMHSTLVEIKLIVLVIPESNEFIIWLMFDSQVFYLGRQNFVSRRLIVRAFRMSSDLLDVLKARTTSSIWKEHNSNQQQFISQ